MEKVKTLLMKLGEVINELNTNVKQVKLDGIENISVNELTHIQNKLEEYYEQLKIMRASLR